jgi:hypothetical protein
MSTMQAQKCWPTMAIRAPTLTKLPNSWSTRKCFNIFSGFLKDPVVFLWTREKASAGLGLKFRKPAFIYLYILIAVYFRLPDKSAYLISWSQNEAVAAHAMAMDAWK